MRRILMGLAVLAIALLLCSCEMLRGREGEAAAALSDLVAAGKITREQYDALLSALTGGGFGEFLRMGGEVALAIVGSMLGVRFWRGSTTDRKGLADALAHVGVEPPKQT